MLKGLICSIKQRFNFTKMNNQTLNSPKYVKTFHNKYHKLFNN